jgi:hypothetical protein
MTEFRKSVDRPGQPASGESSSPGSPSATHDSIALVNATYRTLCSCFSATAPSRPLAPGSAIAAADPEEQAPAQLALLPSHSFCASNHAAAHPDRVIVEQSSSGCYGCHPWPESVKTPCSARGSPVDKYGRSPLVGHKPQRHAISTKNDTPFPLTRTCWPRSVSGFLRRNATSQGAPLAPGAGQAIAGEHSGRLPCVKHYCLA